MKSFLCLFALLALLTPAWSQSSAQASGSLTTVSAAQRHVKRHHAHKAGKHARPKHQKPNR